MDSMYGMDDKAGVKVNGAASLIILSDKLFSIWSHTSVHQRPISVYKPVYSYRASVHNQPLYMFTPPVCSEDCSVLC